MQPRFDLILGMQVKHQGSGPSPRGAFDHVRMGSKFRCMSLTPNAIASTSEEIVNLVECFASSG